MTKMKELEKKKTIIRKVYAEECLRQGTFRRQKDGNSFGAQSDGYKEEMINHYVSISLICRTLMISETDY